MKITVIGVVPPCPRCQRIYDLTVEVLDELGITADIRKIAFDSDAAKQYGRVGTAHDIAEWAQMGIDWKKIWDIASEGWSLELDNFLMPCKEKAALEGWLMTPVLLINNTVVVMGYVPDREYIKAAISKHVQEGKTKI